MGQKLNTLNLWLEIEDLMDFQEPLNKMGFSQLRELDKLDFQKLNNFFPIKLSASERY